MITKKNFFFVLFFLLPIFNYNVNGEILQVREKKIFREKLKKVNFPHTKIKGVAYFTLGALSESSSSESLHFTYENKLKVNTSFNGNDNLLAIFESGNAMDSQLNLDLQSKKGDNLKLSTLFYKFELNDELETIIGPKMFGYHGLAGKSTAYNERIAILDGSNYTTSSGIGPGIGISKIKKNGFSSSIKLSSNKSSFDNGSMHLISQIGLDKKNWGGTVTTNINDEFNAYGLATFYKLGNFPSISASIEYKDGKSTKTIKNWVFAAQQNFQNKKIGIAVGTHNSEEKVAYECWSEINMSDKLKLIPIFFIRENNYANSEIGISINTKFSY